MSVEAKVGAFTVSGLMLLGGTTARLGNFNFGGSDDLILYAGIMAFLILLGLQLEGLTDTNMNQVPIMREFWLLTEIFLSPILTRYES
jgi:hypothetical protein